MDDEVVNNNSLNDERVTYINEYGSFNKVDNSALKVMSPARFYIYTIYSLGFYQIYWFYKNNKMLKEGFNKDINPVLRTIGLFIPIVNWYVNYITLKDFRNLLVERGLESFSLWFNFIFMAIIPFIGLNMFVYLNIQEYINDLCMYENPDIKINRKYSNTELILLIIGVILIILLYFILFTLLIYLLYVPFVPNSF